MGPVTEGPMETSHHIWHEILEIFGPKTGACFAAIVVLAGIWLWRWRRKKI